MPFVILDYEVVATVISHRFQDIISYFEQASDNIRLGYIAPAFAILTGQNHDCTPYEQKFQCAEYSIVTSAFTICSDIIYYAFSLHVVSFPARSCVLIISRTAQKIRQNVVGIVNRSVRTVVYCFRTWYTYAQTGTSSTRNSS